MFQREILALVLLMVLYAPNHVMSVPGDWTGSYYKISSLIVEKPNMAALLEIEGGLPSGLALTECDSQLRFLVIDLSSEIGKSIYSLALSARIADKPILLALGACSGSRPEVTHIWL